MGVLLAILVGIGVLAALIGNVMSYVEHPDYKIITLKNNIEVREYLPMILAEVEVVGERKQAIRQGFKILADYIFGNNTSFVKMEMTAPVTNELNEKMSMTAPVIQQKYMDKWKVRFVMSKKYSFETLPKPKVKDVTLVSVPLRYFAVIRFSGLVNDENIKQYTNELEAYILDQALKSIGMPQLAFYNPPWTLPFLRRNEVMIEVKIK